MVLENNANPKNPFEWLIYGRRVSRNVDRNDKKWQRILREAATFRYLETGLEGKRTAFWPASQPLFCVSRETEKVKVSHRRYTHVYGKLAFSIIRFRSLWMFERVSSFAFVLPECSSGRARSRHFFPSNLYDRFTRLRVISDRLY